MAKRRSKYIRCILVSEDGKRTVEAFGKTERKAKSKAEKKARGLGLGTWSTKVMEVQGITPRAT